MLDQTPLSLFEGGGKPITPQPAVAGEDGGILPTAQVFRVGTGEPCDPGGEGKWYVCPRDGTRVQLPRTCHRWDCPACARRNAWRAAKRAANRLNAIRLLYKLPPLRHVVVSVAGAPPAQTPEDVAAYHADARTLLEGAGFEGGATVFHNERHEGKWCWRDGPHVHAVVWGWSDISTLDGGLVLKVVGVRPELVPTLSYLVDHASTSRRGQLVRYFGFASNRTARVPAPPREDLEAPECPMCGTTMVAESELDWTSSSPQMVGWSS